MKWPNVFMEKMLTFLVEEAASMVKFYHHVKDLT